VEPLDLKHVGLFDGYRIGHSRPGEQQCAPVICWPPCGRTLRFSCGRLRGPARNDYKWRRNADVCARSQIANSKVLIQLADRVEFPGGKSSFVSIPEPRIKRELPSMQGRNGQSSFVDDCSQALQR
jgi:hypothetical protein